MLQWWKGTGQKEKEGRSTEVKRENRGEERKRMYKGGRDLDRMDRTTGYYITEEKAKPSS